MGPYDVSLRHVAQRHPDELVQALLPADRPIEVVGWLDTQVTSIERRLDKALELRVAGRRKLLGVEFEIDYRSDAAFRSYAYQALLLIGLGAQEKALPPPMESVIILLRGRQDPWPPWIEFRSGWSKAWWNGVHVRMEPVYQRTVGELCARPGVFWLVFTPLALDATVSGMRGVIETIRRRVPEDAERAELYVVLLMMAEVNAWGHNLREEIKTMLEGMDLELLLQSTTLREAFEEGEAKGEAKGKAEGKAEGKREVIQEMLGSLLASRMGRELTPAEQEALAKRAAAIDPKRAVDTVFKLEGDALAAWLLDPNAS
jgi:hypothetical protein